MSHQRGRATIRTVWNRFKSLRSAAPSLALAGVLVLVVTGQVLPAQADDVPVRGPVSGLENAPDAVLAPIEVSEPQPASRLQVLIKTIDVSNDRDGTFRGAGDITITATFWRCTGPNPPCSVREDHPAELLALAQKGISADDGQSVNINRLIPLTEDVRNESVASEDGGIAVFSGQTYLFEVNGWEDDGFAGGDFMGGIQRVIKESDGWGVDTYTREAAGGFPDGSLPATSADHLCAGCGEIVVGDYLVTYEIKKAPLPDLFAKSMRVKESTDGGDPSVCVMVENPNGLKAGASFLTLGLDSQIKHSIMGELAAHTTRDECAQFGPISLGQHTISTELDDQKIVPELDENNNTISRAYRRLPITGIDPADNVGVLEVAPSDDGGNMQPTPTPTPELVIVNQAPPDRVNLLVNDIKIKAKNSNGKNDCDSGQNDIAVTVKNEGDGSVKSATVRLLVDGQARGEKSVTNLDKGRSQDVTFEGVQLSKGDHKLSVSVSASGSGNDEKAGNSSKDQSVKCQDGNG